MVKNVLDYYENFREEILKDFPEINEMKAFAYEDVGDCYPEYPEDDMSSYAYEAFAKSASYFGSAVNDEDYTHIFKDIEVYKKKIYNDNSNAFLVTSGKLDGKDFVSVTLIYDGANTYYHFKNDIPFPNTFEELENEEEYEVEINDFNDFIEVMGEDCEDLCEVYSTLFMNK